MDMFEIKEADYQTTCCCCFKNRVARGEPLSGLSTQNIIAQLCLLFMGLHEIKNNFNELEHETAHCMHEKLDLW